MNARFSDFTAAYPLTSQIGMWLALGVFTCFVGVVFHMTRLAYQDWCERRADADRDRLQKVVPFKRSA